MTADTTLGRAFGLYRRTATSRTALLLIIANAIPLIGVLFFGWSLLTILVIYWVENGIVGFWNVPRIMLAQGSAIPNLPELPDSAAAAATRSPEDGDPEIISVPRGEGARGRALASQPARFQPQ